VREQLETLVTEAVTRAVREIDPDAAADLSGVQLAASRSPEHGDFASNAALVLGRRLGISPRELAERIVACLEDPGGVLVRTEIAGPGFINLFLARDRWHEVLVRVLREGTGWGRTDSGSGERVQVEFVSANPTGPLTIGHGRNAVLGDCVARLLEATGHKVSREYYFNDGGRQMRLLADSLRARYEQALGRATPLPPDGYQGQYLVEVAQRLVREQGATWLHADASRFQEAAETAIFEAIRATLERLEVRFDVYYNEHSLYAEGRVAATLDDLRAADLVYEADGAIWLRATRLGLDRDRVLVKSSGEATYLLPDLAYHREKFRRGFQRVIDVLGPDHIEQFPYVKAAMTPLGHDAEHVELRMYQWVNLRRGGELVKMTTRGASYVTVDEVLDEVGADVFRYFMLDQRADTHLEFDLALAQERSERNPVYKIQYAHARLCSIERLARERELEAPAPDADGLERLSLPAEIALARRLGRYPESVARAARARDPHELARYLLDLATEFHSYVSDSRRHRVLSDDRELSSARLALVRAIRITLANGLGLLGISAPERM
jgi:arginyl-tRNA synthetase